MAAIIGSAIDQCQTRKRLALGGSIARALMESHDLPDAANRVLGCFATEMGSCVGEFWQRMGDAGAFSCNAVLAAPPLDEHAVREDFTGETIGARNSLVGAVLERREAIWVSDLQKSTDPARCEPAKRFGLRSAAAFPVTFGGETLGVVAVYFPNREVFDHSLVQHLLEMGHLIGNSIVRIRAEERARRLAAIAESSHDAILSYDFDGTVTAWLAGAERLYGYTAREMVGCSMDRLVPASERERFHAVNQRLRAGETVEPVDTSRVRSDGEHVAVSVSASPVADNLNNIVGVASTDRDMSRQKEAERTLIEAHRQKDDFLAMLGHELRNPLAAIQSASDLIRIYGNNVPEIVKTQKILDRQTGHMAELIDRLIDLSSIIHGQTAIECDQVDLAAACREVADSVEITIAEKRLRFVCDLPPDPLWVEGDRSRLIQVLDNLFSNAIKFTPPGGTVSLELTSDTSGATLSIRDTGRGIESELLSHVFDPFRQGHQDIDRPLGGLGVGLPLVKSLVELHHGSIEASSDGKGCGSEFVVRIPLSRPTGNQPERTPVLKILIIEDNRDSGDALRTLLDSLGYRVKLAPDGKSGVVAAQVFNPDIVLCDLGLPGGTTGFQVAEALRADPGTSNSLILAVSGYGLERDKQRSKEAGFDDHVTKPINVDQLTRRLQDFQATRAR